MRRRHPLPQLWLMTDERMGEALWPALARLPRGAGVVFRHYRVDPAMRRAVFARVRLAARRRGLVLVLAGTAPQARAWGADGVHGTVGGRRHGLLRTAAVHGVRELRRAGQAKADLIFVSPVFATRSHPGAAGLGTLGFAGVARMATMPAMALGGMDARRFARLRPLGAAGWAAIDAWLS